MNKLPVHHAAISEELGQLFPAPADDEDPEIKRHYEQTFCFWLYLIFVNFTFFSLFTLHIFFNFQCHFKIQRCTAEFIMAHVPGTITSLPS